MSRIVLLFPITNDKGYYHGYTPPTSAHYPHPAVSTVVLDMIQYSLSILYNNRRPMRDQPEGRNTVYVRHLGVMTWRQKHTATRIGTTMVLHLAQARHSVAATKA